MTRPEPSSRPPCNAVQADGWSREFAASLRVLLLWSNPLVNSHGIHKGFKHGKANAHTRTGVCTRAGSFTTGASVEATNLTAADVLDRRALAARWRVSTRSIARLEASGAGPRAFRVGRLVRWTLDEVRRFQARAATKRRSYPSWRRAGRTQEHIRCDRCLRPDAWQSLKRDAPCCGSQMTRSSSVAGIGPLGAWTPQAQTGCTSGCT
jgi:predicted DNA-binding transcriptional regulator AlpA